MDNEAATLHELLKRNDEIEMSARKAALGVANSDRLPPAIEKEVYYVSKTDAAIRHLEANTGEDLDENDPRVKTLAQALVALRTLDRLQIDISNVSVIR